MACPVQPSTLIGWLERRRPLAPFQRRFLRGAFRPGVYTAILSGPRGVGKSSLSAEILSAYLDPAGPLHRPGAESVLLASSLDQARITFGFLRGLCTGAGYRWQDSGQRVAVFHKASGARVRVASSDAKRAFGLGANTPAVVGDEPGSWQERGGALMYDALTTSGGKSDTRLFLIGTRAPGAEGGWWRSLLAEPDDPGTYRQIHDAPLDADGEVIDWSSWRTIRRALPLLDWNPHLRPKLDEELRKAKRSDDARRRFITYRLNRPQQPARAVLVTAGQWRAVEGRPVPAPTGRPIVGLDVGSSRAWSTAAVLWPSGRLAGLGVAPGVPGLDAQAKRDGKRAGLYDELREGGILTVDEGRRVVRVAALVERVMAYRPAVIVCDRFRLPAVLDAVGGRVPVVARVTRWSESTADIMALRRAALDGPLSVAPECRRIFRFALAESTVEHDDAGNVRLVKGDTHNTHRDDLAAALVLAAGARSRRRASRAPRIHVCAVA